MGRPCPRGAAAAWATSKPWRKSLKDPNCPSMEGQFGYVTDCRHRKRSGWRWAPASLFAAEIMTNARLSQNKAGCLMLAGRVLQAGESLEVIVGGNWHHAVVHKNTLWEDLILDNGRIVAGAGLIARPPKDEALDREISAHG